MSKAAAPSAHARLLPLDGVRGIAILVVMLHHFIPAPESATGGLHWFLRLADTGWWGVDLFFVLSGFLITGILYDAKGSSRPLTNFYMRRVLRIFPLYYAVLALLFIVLPLLAGTPLTSKLFHLKPSTFTSLFGDLAHQQGWLWTYCANIKLSLEGNWTSLGFLNHFWSLAVEEHFYLFWPLIILHCERTTAIKWCLAFAGAALAARSWCVLAHAPFVAAYTLTPCRMDSLALGALAALLWRRPETNPGLPLKARTLALSLFPLAAAALLFLRRDDPAMIVAGSSMLAVFFASGVMWASGASPDSLLYRVLCSHGLRLFGTYSYGLYVFHYILRDPLTRLLRLDHNILLTHSPILGVALRVLVLTAISLLVALASWNLFEKQFLRLKRLFQDSAARPVVHTPEALAGCLQAKPAA